METTFTDAAGTALLALDISDDERTALKKAAYNASRNTWAVDVSPETEQHLMELLQADNTGPLYRDS
ncbi:hypothetical protein [Streptomyces sp. NPDC052496]|uniref:hypothetical protein n=1 Tax=Streptomyces sp. NPDC052496 TaxID=3154951 RepID=UPI00341F453C